MRAVAILIVILGVFQSPPPSLGQTLAIDNLRLVPAADPINVLTLDVDAGVLGSDSEKSTLTGDVVATLEMVWNGATYTPTGLNIASGSVDASDVDKCAHTHRPGTSCCLAATRRACRLSALRGNGDWMKFS